MRIANSVVDLIGHTPLVRLNSVTRGVTDATVVAKVEYMNPGGSAKDRIAIGLIDAAEKAGHLKPGGTIVEPTSGNTGVGLALVAQQRGYKCIFVCPDKVSEDKRRVLQAYGAEVVVTPTNVEPEDPESYYSVSDRLAREIPGAFKPNQYANPAGPMAHFETTGPEIWADTDGRITHFVAGVGTGGTITGTGRYLKEVSAGAVQVVGADPEGSIYAGGEARPYLVEGVGEDFWPPAYDPTIPDRIVTVTDAQSFDMTRRLAREEGLLVGGSCGMAAVAALEVAKDAGPNDLIVVLLPDSGRGYLQKVFDDQWMERYGFHHRDSSDSSWGAALERLGAPIVVSSPDDDAATREKLLDTHSRAVGVIAKQNAPLQPGEIKGWFNKSNPGVVRSAHDLITMGFGQPFDPEFSSPHPVTVLKEGKVVAVVTTKELQADTL
jgi:cystathionine beta-synthase